MRITSFQHIGPATHTYAPRSPSVCGYLLTLLTIRGSLVTTYHIHDGSQECVLTASTCMYETRSLPVAPFWILWRMMGYRSLGLWNLWFRICCRTSWAKIYQALSIWKLCSRAIMKEGWIVRPPFRDALHRLHCLRSLSWHLPAMPLFTTSYTFMILNWLFVSRYTLLLKIRYLINPLLQGMTALHSIMVWL
jgi:hypothetical protein